MKLTKHQLALHKFASPSMLKPALACVLTDGITAVATDSFRLVEIKTIAPDADKPSKAPMMLPASILKQIKMGKNDSTIHLSPTTIQTTNATYNLPKLEDPADFPSYQQIFPTDTPLATVMVNAKYLAEICTALSALDPFAKITLEVHGPLKPLVIRAIGSGSEARAMLMPLTA